MGAAVRPRRRLAARAQEFLGKTLLDGLVFLPLVLPPVVTGYLPAHLVRAPGADRGFLDNHFGIVFSFRWTGAALACGVMGFPLMVRRSGSRSRRSIANLKTPPRHSG